MAESQKSANEISPLPTLAERVERYRQEVERVVREVGEHPQYEMKRSCSLSNLAEKIEFVKDVQSIATSRIETEKFLVIGADEKAKVFCSVTNSNEFDEASIRQILDKYLSPVPAFQLFRLESSDGHTFILFVIPKQSRRRILAKVTVPSDDAKNLVPKLLLREGDLWTKGSSTGKRLAKVEDWDDIYDEVIEAQSEHKARVRTAHTIDMALAREKMKSYAGASLPSVFTDEEFQAIMEDVCTTKNEARFKLLLERLRDDTVEGWHSIGAYENPFDSNFFNDGPNSIENAQQRTREHIKNVLRPSMHWLTLAGIYTIKNSGPTVFLDWVVDLLKEIFETTYKLRVPRAIVATGQLSASIDDHISHTVPALESLISMHLIGAFIAKRNRFEYLRTLFRADVYSTGWQGERRQKSIMAFWPLDISTGYGEPQDLRKWGGRLNLCANRVRTDLAYAKLFGSNTVTINALCQYEFCLELNSFLAMPELSPATAAYIGELYSGFDFTFRPDFIVFPMEPLHTVATSLHKEIVQAKPNLLKVILFDQALWVQMTKPGVEQLYGHFLDQLTRQRAEIFIAQHHYPPDPAWPPELENELKQLRDSKN